MDKIRITSLLRNNGCITVNKYLIQVLGLSEAVLYCELCSRFEYFEDKEILDDGYFYNTQYDLQAGTGLGEKAQRTAISKLKKLNLIDVVRKGIPAKRYFKIIDDDENLLNLLSMGKEKLKRLENPIDTSIGGNLKRKRKEQDNPLRSGNNTNNNTKNNINIKGILTDVKASYLFLEIINYYLDKYELIMGEQHPILKKEHWISVVQALRYIDLGMQEADISEDEEMLMIDRHFATDYKKDNVYCDYNILHYISGDIRKNRYYEEIFNKEA